MLVGTIGIPLVACWNAFVTISAIAIKFGVITTLSLSSVDTVMYAAKSFDFIDSRPRGPTVVKHRNLLQ